MGQNQGQPSRLLSRRNSDLAKIHIGAKQLVGDDDEAYRDMLEAVAGPGDPVVRGEVPRRRPRPRPRPELVPALKTIDALCIHHPGGRKPRGWAEAILKRMTGSAHRAPLEWATAGQLQGVAQSIRIDIRRHESRRGGGAA